MDAGKEGRMRPSGFRANWRCVPYLLLAACALGSGGCLAVAIGGAAAGAAVGYTYFRGNVSADFPADFNTTWAATQAALLDLGMPVNDPKRTSDTEGTLTTQTGDGTKVSIELETRAARIPTEGPITEIEIRVGLIGDRAVSERLMSQIQVRLAQGVQPAPAPVAASLPQTAPPPLAPEAATVSPTGWQRPATR
jgi:hypothetical protein